MDVLLGMDEQWFDSCSLHEEDWDDPCSLIQTEEHAALEDAIGSISYAQTKCL